MSDEMTQIRLSRIEQDFRSFHGLSKSTIGELIEAAKLALSLEAVQKECDEALAAWRYAAEFHKDDNGYRLNKLVSGTKPSELYTELKHQLAESREVSQAAWRLQNYTYMDWSTAGGPKDCKHGISIGIHCQRCDEQLVNSTAIDQQQKGQKDE